MSCHLYHGKSWIFLFTSKSKHQYKSTHIFFIMLISFSFFYLDFFRIFFFHSFIRSQPSFRWLCASQCSRWYHIFPKRNAFKGFHRNYLLPQILHPTHWHASNHKVIPSQKLSSFHWMKIIEKAQNHANALYLCDLSKLQMENHNEHTRIIIEDLMRVLTIQMQKSFFFFNKWIWKMHLFLCLNIYSKWVLDTE